MRSLDDVQKRPEQGGSAARVRGAAVAAVSATMAVAAHGAAGAAAPDTAGALLLLGLAAVLAAAATSLPWLSSTAMGLLSLLGAGQLAGHLVLEVSAHHPGAIDASMVAAHVAAVAGCAGLIALAEQIGPRCAAALSRVLPQLGRRYQW